MLMALSIAAQAAKRRKSWRIMIQGGEADIASPPLPILSNQRQTSSRDYAAGRQAHEVHAGRYDATAAVGAVPAHGMDAPLPRPAFQPPDEPTGHVVYRELN